MENIYDAPKAELIEQPNSEHGRPFFVTSITKMSLLFMVTLGVYVLYWGYKQWDSQRFSMGKTIYPILRTIFMVFFTHSLFRLITQRLQAMGQPSEQYRWAPTLFVVFTIFSSVLGAAGDRLYGPGFVGLVVMVVLLVVQLLPMVAIQRQANLASLDPTGESNSTLSGWNWLFLVLGVVLWLFVIAGFVLIALGMDGK
jgi:hypothetical protein